MKRTGLVVALALAPLSAFAADIKGNWLTEEGKARVTVDSCGQGVCGKIVWLKEPNDKSGKPQTDILNEDKSLRTRPIIGVQVVEFTPASATNWKGKVYNPEDGKSYSGEANLLADGKLVVKGCGLGGLICEDETWTRAN